MSLRKLRPRQQVAPTVKTGTALKAKAASPAQSATAKNQSQKTTAGKGKAAAKASAPSSATRPVSEWAWDTSGRLECWAVCRKKGVCVRLQVRRRRNPTECGVIAASDATGDVTVAVVN